jgi:hypothetical protein
MNIIQNALKVFRSSPRDYAKSPPYLFNEQRPWLSLLFCVFAAIGIKFTLIAFGQFFLFAHEEIPHKKAWLAIAWAMIGAVAWWADKVRYEVWRDSQGQTQFISKSVNISNINSK